MILSSRGLKRRRQSFDPFGLAVGMADQILANLDQHRIEAARLAMHRHGLIAIVFDTIGFIGDDREARLLQSG